MIPDAIIIFSAGIVPLSGGGWRSTTYDDRDAFGTLGGRDRVEAAAFLAREYPKAHLVTTSHALEGGVPSLAQIYAEELHGLGIAKKRIILEERSSATQTAIVEALRLSEKMSWKRLLLLSSEYHLPRIEAFYKRTKNAIAATLVSSESVLMHNDPTFGEYFSKVKKTPGYRNRLVAEQQGKEAIEQDTYRPALPVDKKERLR